MDSITKKEFLKEHFCYEVEMLCNSIVYLKKFHSKNNQVGINLALECFLLHARNLIEFLYHGSKLKPDDARASDFIDRRSWDKLASSKAKNLENLQKRANKEISHLTYTRHYETPPEKNWDPEKYFLEIIAGVKNFIDCLPQKYISNKINKLSIDIKKLKK